MYKQEKAKTLKYLAVSNRKNPTDAERKIWSYLRNNNLGRKFRRQQQIENYIVDFYCAERKLIIECDGGQHCESKTDEERKKYLELHGYKILRFWNTDILKNIEGVCEVIKKEL
ncbi:MAG: endonuclease domain-containing protein [Elusimicrobiota bacterium]|jgi:very-short-patch-repair endonuclease|nr:endonuclease domain-containing protein [Elusimicrobiota bacterium]